MMHLSVQTLLTTIQAVLNLPDYATLQAQKLVYDQP